MKKFYETPAVEFTGFNAEDVITTSIVDTINMSAENLTKFNASVAASEKTAAIQYNSYNW